VEGVLQVAQRSDRREFIRTLGLGAAALGAGALSAGNRVQAQARRPNIVFFLIDDMRFDAMGFMGHPSWLRTPNIDRLRAEGALFANAFVVDSLCSPSRAAFLSGRYGHCNGVRDNMGHELSPEVRTYPMLLQEAGYDTAFVGKWHMANTNMPRPGFNYWLSFTGQGVYERPTLNEDGRQFQAEGYMTDLLTDYALNYLQRPRTGPFSLCLWHKAIHGPYTPAERHKNLYTGEEYPKPVSWDDTFETKPHWQRAVAHGAGGPNAFAAPCPDKLELRPWDGKQEGRLNYYRSLAAVDDSVGKVYDMLQRLGQLDDTIIVFAGDNGYFLGEHRRGDKRLMYEESLRIPLLIRYPRMVAAGSTVEQMVLNIDMAPTFLEAAGVDAPAEMQGRSTCPLFSAQAPAWRPSFLYEYVQEGRFLVPTMLGVRTERWKYVTYPTLQDLDELYDLQTDPHEMTNLAADPAFAGKLAEMKAELERLKKETGYVAPPAPTPAANTPPRVQPAVAVLSLSFDDASGQVKDTSGKGVEVRQTGGESVEGRTGKALRFGGKDFLEVPKTEAIRPDNRALALEMWVKPEAPDGALAAFGGASHGYCLYLKSGVPRFAVRIEGELFEAAGKQPLGDGWTHLAATIDASAKVHLYVNGQEVGVRQLPAFIVREPSDALSIGTDRGSAVVEYGADPGYKGLLDGFTLYDGVLEPAAIAAAAK
jgi:arylsulfatase A-like enzyme